MEENTDSELVMVSFLRSGRCWWVLRVFSNHTFDLFYTTTQPNTDEDVRRERYQFSELENAVKVGELQDWVRGVIGL